MLSTCSRDAAAPRAPQSGPTTTGSTSTPRPPAATARTCSRRSSGTSTLSDHTEHAVLAVGAARTESHRENEPWSELLMNASPNSNTRSRSEEHTSELQSRRDLVCRLLLEKKKIQSTVAVT